MGMIAAETSAPRTSKPLPAARRLLVMSQKGGVGKRTSAINLAAAASRGGARVLLADADPSGSVAASLNLASTDVQGPHIGLGGVALGGVDLLLQGEAGLADEEALGAYLDWANSEEVRRRYDWVILDSPPFLGGWMQRLLASCDELILVMRAEPISYRTLPPVLEAIRVARRNAATIRFRGILLTLPPGEPPGGPWENRLREDLRGGVLPQAIPHDATVAQALHRGTPVVLADPESPASRQYRALATTLNLTGSRPQALR